MNSLSQLTCAFLLLAITVSTFTNAQKSISGPQKGSPEMMEAAAAAQIYGAQNSDTEVLNKVQGQLYNTLELLQAYQEGGPLKFAEKRRNKFEFIRFGRR